jgi:hypothetical protein
MDINKIISIIRNLKEDGGAASGGMVANAPATQGGFGVSSDPKGPTAGFDPVMGGTRRKPIFLGKGSRRNWLPKKPK